MEYGKLGNTDIEEPYVPHEIVGAIDKNPAQGVTMVYFLRMFLVLRLTTHISDGIDTM